MIEDTIIYADAPRCTSLFAEVNKESFDVGAILIGNPYFEGRLVLWADEVDGFIAALTELKKVLQIDREGMKGEH
jgi:hypothetical protein